MSQPLKEIPLGDAFAKFGEGSHKPGSGSAVALQGMLSAQMIRTVIDLTLSKGINPGMKDEFERIKKEIEVDIYPKLVELLEEDSIQFHKVIVARTARDEAKEIEKKCELEFEQLSELRTATEMPITVAKLCIRLTERALTIFDNGFQAVRGDSSVAINGALSAIGGSLSIINLNLQSYNRDIWTERITKEAEKIDKTYNLLLKDASDRQIVLKKQTDTLHAFDIEISNLKKGMNDNEKLSDEQIEKFAAGIQNVIWKYKEVLWKKTVPVGHLEILNPKVILKKLGYQFKAYKSLGINEANGDTFEVAGIIDSKKKYVSVSGKFPTVTVDFTIAHELGHALLHPNQVLHRDRPMDGSSIQVPLDYKEKQANRFAACFLMPRRQIISEFQTRFGITKIQLNSKTAADLGMKLSDLHNQCKSARDLGRIIASTQIYSFSKFDSLTMQFGVSNGAMAVRLVELDLVTL